MSIGAMTIIGLASGMVPVACVSLFLGVRGRKKRRMSSLELQEAKYAPVTLPLETKTR